MPVSMSERQKRDSPQRKRFVKILNRDFVNVLNLLFVKFLKENLINFLKETQISLSLWAVNKCQFELLLSIESHLFVY